MQTRVTLRDVAAKAGVHHTTASRALKNDPRVCPETLKKIRTLADQMGYMPDPMLSALNAYRHASRSAQDHGSIAWITNYPTRDGWRASSCYKLYFDGAAERLSRLGYRLEEFWLQETGMTARRSSQVLFHRGHSRPAHLPPPRQPRPPEPAVGNVLRRLLRLLPPPPLAASPLRLPLSRPHYLHA